ncbi:hypothetical protein MMC30_009375 [Trapelia coarctata]|nr:hypothetical protein [Trapelia coarctata]
MSPRRSSRARTTQPPASAPVQTNSSTSSISSGRAERSTRSHQKTSSPHISTLPRSVSLDEPDEQPKPSLRRTRSGHEDVKDTVPVNDPELDDEEAEEDDVTRCICGFADYQGLPVSRIEALKQAARDDDNPYPSDIILEELGGLFIQCDTCKVWQHGGCVGILDDAKTPDEYFCELCRKDFHGLMTADNEQKYSQYLPVQDNLSPPGSPELSPRDSVSKKGNGSKMSRPNAEALAHKRRSTMNSRDAAYDEAEQLRRAIEESKKEGGAPSVDNGSRRNKRSRSDSEDRKDPSKRQRTNSHSSTSTLPDKAHAPPASSSDEALAATRPSNHSPKKIRAAAARNHHAKEQREQREKERATAAERRAARSERRRGDDSDPSDELPPRNTTNKNSTRVPDSIHTLPPSPNTPPTLLDPPSSKPTSHKKTGRPSTKRGRVGRNQYTKDRDLPPATHNRNGSQLEVTGADTPVGRGRSRSRSNAGDTRGGSVNGNGINVHGANGGPNGYGNNNGGSWDGGKPSKPKHMNPNRTSLNEMKRRVAGIMEFVSRTQIELEGREERTPPGSGGSASSVRAAEVNGTADTRLLGGGTLGMSGLAVGGGGPSEKENKDLIQSVINGLDAHSHSQSHPSPADAHELNLDERAFTNLTSAEMMSVLKTRLVGWQREYGVWGEK